MDEGRFAKLKQARVKNPRTTSEYTKYSRKSNILIQKTGPEVKAGNWRWQNIEGKKSINKSE